MRVDHSDSDTGQHEDDGAHAEPSGDDLFSIHAPEPSAHEMSRRDFMNKATITLAGLVAVAMASPVAAFLLAPLFNKPADVWRSVGAVSSYQTGSTVQIAFQEASPLSWAGVTAQTAAWMRKVSDSEFICFTVSCSHLGCPVQWVPGGKLFMCPCHGGVYYDDGSVAAGPPPYALARYPTRVINGDVQVQVSAKPEPPADSAGTGG